MWLRLGIFSVNSPLPTVSAGIYFPTTISDEFQLQLELWNTAIWLVVTINSMIISLDSLTGGSKLMGGGINKKYPRLEFNIHTNKNYSNGIRIIERYSFELHVR